MALSSVLCVLTRHWQRAAEARQLQLRQQQQQNRERQAELRRQRHLDLLRHLEQEGLRECGECSCEQAWCPAQPYEKVRDEAHVKALGSQGEDVGGDSSAATPAAATAAGTTAAAAADEEEQKQQQQEKEEQAPGEQQQPKGDPLAASSGATEKTAPTPATSSSSSSSSRGREVCDAAAVVRSIGRVGAPDDANASCAICFEPFLASALVRLLPCQHVFHAECIDAWLQRSLLCPLCMRDFTPQLGVPSPPPSRAGPRVVADASAALALLAFIDTHSDRLFFSFSLAVLPQYYTTVSSPLFGISLHAAAATSNNLYSEVVCCCCTWLQQLCLGLHASAAV
ncbi:hypothetical protein Emed_000346 [Eimeria media]